MIIERHFKLIKQARKSGGDRYEETPEEGQMTALGTIYLSQQFSRQGGQVQSIKVLLSTYHVDKEGDE